MAFLKATRVVMKMMTILMMMMKMSILFAVLNAEGGVNYNTVALMDALHENDLHTFEDILQETPALSQMTAPNGGTVLEMMMTEGASEEFIKALINAGAETNIITTSGMPVAMMALEEQNLRVFRLLAESGADLTSSPESGTTLLEVAVRTKNLRALRLLMEVGVSIDEANSMTGMTALMTAAVEGDVGYIRAILSHHPNNDLQNKKGDTALHIAASLGHHEIVQLLVENCANTTITNNNGKTAYNLAVENDHPLSAAVINKGIIPRARPRPHPQLFPNRRDRSGEPCSRKVIGETRFHSCREQICGDHPCFSFVWANTGTPDPACVRNLSTALRNRDLKTFETLLRSNKDLATQTNKEGLPLVFTVVEENLSQFIRVMSEIDINLDATSSSGLTPVMAAIQDRKKEAFDALLRFDADVNIANNDGVTPLMVASALGLTDYVKGLLPKVSSVNIKDTQPRGGLTALHRATAEGHVRVVEELLKSCPDTDVVSAKGQTSRDMAEELGQTRIVNLIDAHVRAACSADGVTYAIGDIRFDNCEQMRCEKTCQFVSINEQDPSCLSNLLAALRERNDTDFYRILSTAPHLVLSTEYGLPIMIEAADENLPEYVNAIAERGGALSANGLVPLVWATQKDYSDLFNVLVMWHLQTNVSLNAVDDKGESALMVAAEAGLLDYVSELLSEGADLNLQNNEGLSALHLASENGHLLIVEQLLQKCPDTNLLSNDNKTAVDLATERGNNDVANLIKAFIKTTCPGVRTPRRRVDSVRVDGCNELRCDSSCTWVPTGELASQCVAKVYDLISDRNLTGFGDLLSEYPDLRDVANKGDGLPVLFSAMADGLDNFDSTAADGSTVIDALNSVGETPLMVAAKHGLLDFMDILLQHNANTSLQNKEGLTALHLASQQEQFEAVERLLESCPDPNILSVNNKTALDLAKENGNTTIPDYILDHISTTCLGSDGQGQPLGSIEYKDCQELQCHFSCQWVPTGKADPECAKKVYDLFKEQNDTGFVELLRQYPSLVNVTDVNGIPMLFSAVHQNMIKFVQILAENGANLNAPADAGVTPLIWATHRGHAEIFNILLEHGADVDITDDEGSTPLIKASALGDSEYVKSLLVYQASIDYQHKDRGITALHVACLQDHPPAVALLLSKCADTSLKDARGKTASDLAFDNGYFDMVAMIKSHRSRACNWEGKKAAVGAIRYRFCKQLVCSPKCSWTTTGKSDPTCANVVHGPETKLAPPGVANPLASFWIV